MARNRTRARSSSLFLLELIIAIVFFAAASAVCVQLFVRSHSLSVESRQLNAMTNEASAVAEIIYNSDSKEEAVSSLNKFRNKGDINKNSGTIQLHYNKDFNKCDDTDAAYVMNIELSQDGNLLKAEIVCSEPDADKPIFSQPIRHAVSESEADQ